MHTLLPPHYTPYCTQQYSIVYNTLQCALSLLYSIIYSGKTFRLNHEMAEEHYVSGQDIFQEDTSVITAHCIAFIQ